MYHPQGAADYEPVRFKSQETNLHYVDVLDIEPIDLSQELRKKAGDILIIDVRHPEEFDGELGHIPGATLMTLDDEFEGLLSGLSDERVIVFVCRSGGRSARAANIARQKGFKQVYNLKGGMILWNELHLPTEV